MKMYIRDPANPETKQSWSSLPTYGHLYCHFEKKLLELFLALDQPKESNLAQRFHVIKEIFKDDFHLELLYHLKLIHLPSSESKGGGTSEKDTHHSPKLLLHIWSLLDCTTSILAIANVLEISYEEVIELIRELHNTFSIDPLVARLREYFKANKFMRERHTISKTEEFLGNEPVSEPEDSTEYRRRRRRRRYPNNN